MLENKRVVIAGAGHAGIEAALAVTRAGGKALLVTMDKSAIGRLSCNPAIGGLAKSHLVHEIDALGGIMGVAADANALQYKTLNKTKGRAVWSTRVQIDKKKYPKYIQGLISKNKNIDIVSGEVVSFTTRSERVISVTTKKGDLIKCGAFIVTCGTFLNGLIHIGNKNFKAGRMGEKRSSGLTEYLVKQGFETGRLKTGTPPRVSRKSIDFTKVLVAPGEKNFTPFSIFSKKRTFIQEDCFIVNTNKKVHEQIFKNINSSAMFSGKIKAIGPRYCPSIEDKIHRFSDRSSHHLFLEPEWSGSNQIYVNGFSTSLSEKTQLKSLREIKALENVDFIRPGYAIEYDFIPPRQLKASLESKVVGGLFFAGQINGTSGYEEAAAQGLVAGVNAYKYIYKKEPLILSRSSSYIGVMVDDLVTSHLDEPYRMFTSRAEHRLFLRPDNCYSRLFGVSKKLNLLTDKQMLVCLDYLDLLNNINKKTENESVFYNKKKKKLSDLIKRPEINLLDFSLFGEFSNSPYFSRALFEVETSHKYEGYIVNEKQRILKNKSLESLKIPFGLDYTKIVGLSNESKERLQTVKPETLGQASRIDGIRPTDITVVGVFVGSLEVSRET